MNKLLLLGAGLLVSSNLFAVNIQEVWPNEFIGCISPNGIWVAGDIEDGCVVIKNLETGDEYEYMAKGTMYAYQTGSGNGTPISNTGVVVGSTTGSNPAYWENGDWKTLRTLYPTLQSLASSVTKEGDRICGSMGSSSAEGASENIMFLPVVWDRRDDGSFSDAKVLPHPVKDFTNRVPMYIFAVAMSADGSVIGGQMIDYTGLVAQPIVWREDDNGEWSYELLQPQLTNPSGEEFPPYPGEWEGGGQPVPEQFMTPEEVDAWVNGMQTGGSYSPFDYMTEEEIDAYYEALNKHEEEIEEWETAWDKWNAVYSKVVSNPNMVNYQFNNVEISSDGRYYLSTRINSEDQILYPVVMDLESNDYRYLDGSDNLLVSGFSDNYSVLTTWIDPLGVLPKRAYIYPELSDTAMTLEEFVGQTSPEVATWMEDEMIRDVETATGGVTDFMCSGIPIASADLSLIVTRMQVQWLDAPLGQWLYSYAFSTGIESTGVENVAAAENGMTVLPNGDVVLNGGFKSLNIYNISGMSVFEATAPQGTVATNLDRGIYIYKAVSNDGKEIVRKIAL